MDYSGVDNPELKYEYKTNKSGYDFCDLVGFGMTILKRELFSKIDKPYFVCENNQREDNYFCDKLHSVGIKPMGCFDFTLTHDGIDESEAKRLQELEYSRLLEEIKIKYPQYVGKKLVIAS